MQRGSIIRNTSFLFTAHLAGRILSFVLTILLPRYLEGKFDDLRKFSYALWLTNLLATLTELGLHTPLVREVAADRSKASLLISNALVIRLILSVITFMIIVALVKLLYAGEMAVIVYVVGLSEIINALAQLFRCVFRSFENMEFEAIGVILERSVVFSLGIGVVIMGYGIVGFCAVVLIASVLNFTLTLLIMLWKFNRLGFRFLDAGLCMGLLKQSLPFAMSGILYMTYFRIDGVMLKHIMGSSGDLAVGWYATGYSFVTALTIIPGAFMGAVFPVMSRTLSPSAVMDFLFTKSFKAMFIMAFPIAVGVTFLADRIVLILYPSTHFAFQDQEALSGVLKVLIWAGALIFLNTVMTTVFRATDKRRAFLIIIAIGVCINVGFNLILIPKYSYLGAAVSMIITESILFLCSFWYIQKRVCRLTEFSFLFKSALASGLLALGLAWVREYIPIILSVCLATGVYLAVILLLKGITREDIAMIRGKYKE